MSAIALGVSISLSGAGASATATVVDGVVTGTTVVTQGYYFPSAPPVQVTTPISAKCTTPLVLTAVLSGGVLTSMTITNPGAGYLATPTIIVLGDGASAAVTLTMVAGAVSAVTITNGGHSYTWATAFTYHVGVDATFTANLTGDKVTSLTIVNGGTGYINPPSLVMNTSAGMPTTVDKSMNADTLASLEQWRLQLTTPVWTTVDGVTTYTTPPIYDNVYDMIIATLANLLINPAVTMFPRASLLAAQAAAAAAQASLAAALAGTVT